MGNNIRTRPIDIANLRVLQRVQVITGEHRGKLGTISGVAAGCSCRDGWTYVILDDGTRDEFRHGYRGDTSDLALVTWEPDPPTLNFIAPGTAEVDMAAKIWAGSQSYGHFADQGTGKITETNYHQVYIEFASGLGEWFVLGVNTAQVLVSNDPIPPIPEKLNHHTAKLGMAVRAAQGHYARNGVGEIVKIYTGGWNEVICDVRFIDDMIGTFELEHGHPILLETDEPIPPKTGHNYVITAQAGMAVEILPKGIYRRHSHLGVAEVISTKKVEEQNQANLRFSDGTIVEVVLGEYQGIIHTDKPIPPQMKFLTEENAELGLPVMINPSEDKHHASLGQGTIAELDRTFDEVRVTFDNTSEWFNYGTHHKEVYLVRA